MLKQVDQMTSEGWYIDWCNICEMLHTSAGVKTIPDIRSWSHEKKCYPPIDDPIFYQDPLIPGRGEKVVDYSNLQEFKETHPKGESYTWRMS